MMRKLINVFAPPIQTGFYRERLRRNLDAVLFILTISFGLAFIANEAPESRIGTGVMVVFLLLILRFFTEGDMVFARISSPLIGYLSISYLIFTGFGIHSVTVPALCALIICARALGTALSAVFYLGLSMVTLAIAYQMQARGMLDLAGLAHAHIVDLFNLYIALIATTAAVWFLAKNIEDDRDMAYQAAHDLDEKQKALADKERQYRLLADNAHDFIWTAGLDFTFTYCSPSCERIMGYKPKEVVGRSIFFRLVPEQRPEDYLEILEQELDIESPSHDVDPVKFDEVPFLRKDGSRGWVETYLSLLLDDDFKPIGIVGTSRDVTEKIAAQNKAREIADQLRHAQKIDSIGQLAGGIAHDFSNVLVAVQGYSDLIDCDDCSAEDARRYAAEIKKAAVRAETLTSQLLTFSRRQAMESRPVALNNVLMDISDMLSRLLPATVSVRFDLDAQIDEILGDSDQLGQLVINLCVNARDAMPEGGAITLQTRNVEITPAESERFPNVLPGRYVQLCVSDTGSGMSSELRNRIFEPFFTTKQTGQGTGLGLSVVHGIVVEHGGFIDVHSIEGTGTAMLVNFPKSDLEAPTRNLIEFEESLPGGNETILIVEDEEQVRDLATLVLSQAGYTVLTAADGVLGWELFLSQKDNIRLVISDVVMPRMGGRELLKLIREVNASMPFMFTSGYVGGPDPGNFRREYGVDFLPKPFSGAILQRQVRAVLDNHHIQRSQCHVLAIDDSSANLNLMKMDVEELGHRITTVECPREAITLCENDKFDLIFVDLQMQPMNGIEACKILKDCVGEHTRIVGLTAHCTEEERQACLDAGMQQVITKPLRYDALIQLLGGEWADEDPVDPMDQYRTTTIFDVDVSIHLANNRPGEADKLLGILMRELPKDQQAINEAFERDDISSLLREVHKLNGAVRYCGAPALTHAVKQLETAGKTGDRTSIGVEVEHVNQRVTELIEWYRENPHPFFIDVPASKRRLDPSDASA